MKDKYDLNEIASWVENNSDVEIPALQRGLVWKPSQVELLWDSILRGFPIGSFMLSEKDEQKNSYYLMDGQQRFNAIAIGYNKIRKEQSPAILWIDIEPNTDVKTTRAYWVKVTTISHPWGFRNDDDCNKLSAPERRDALDKYEKKGTNIYNDVINLKETWPHCAECPIPLFIFLNANTNSKEKFVQDVIAGIEKYKEEFSFLKKIEIDKIKEKVEALHEPFKRLKEYQVSVNILSREVISQESDRTSSNSETTTLETLFTRLNTGGTRISQEDLSYSAIKAYWPEIKDLNDELASFYMKPEKLAMFVFRLMQTLDGRDYLANDLSLKQIRLLASDESKKAKIIDFYKSEHLNEVLSIIDKWLGIKEVNDTHTPALFRMKIVSDSPDLYLLLMYLAYKYPNIDTIVMRGLAFYLHWFALKPKECANIVYKNCKDEISIERIDKALYAAMDGRALLRPYSMEEITKDFDVNVYQDGNYGAKYWNQPWWHFLEYSFWKKELLLYAERAYLNTHFKLYCNPTKYGILGDHSSPWDYDHITPRDWMSNKHNAKYMRYCQYWRDNIGNLAAIPFEVNRSKSNGDNYEEYKKDKETLLFDERSLELDTNLVRDEEQANKFVTTTYDRFRKIYNECASLWNSLFHTEYTSDRKKLFEDIKAKKDVEFHFVSETKEFPLENQLDWSREWISCGYIVNGYYICICLDANNFEIGLRKKPGDEQLKKELVIKDAIQLDKFQLESYTKYNPNNNDWWYLEKDINKKDISDKEILSEWKKLEDFVNELK